METKKVRIFRFVKKCPGCGAMSTPGCFVNLLWKLKCINQKFDIKQNLVYFIFFYLSKVS